MTWLHRGSCLLLALLTGVGLSACGNGWEEETPVPMGRFAEETVTLPAGSDNTSLSAVRVGPDGAAHMIMQDENGYYLAHLEQGSLTREPAPWLAHFPYTARNTDIWENISGFDFRPAGGAYVITNYHDGTDPDNPTNYKHLYVVDEKGKKEITPAGWSAEGFYGGGGINSNITATAGGFWVYESFSATVKQYLESDTSAPIKSLPGLEPFALSGDNLWIFAQNASALLRYSVESGELLQQIAYSPPEITALSDYLPMETAVAAGNDGSFYLADREGVHRYMPGADAAETVVDGSLNSMNAPSCHIGFLSVESDTSLYINYYQSFSPQRPQLFRYRYRDDIASYPPVELTVYGLENSALAREAAVAFQRLHPEVRVTIRVGEEEVAGNTAEAREDALLTLNTELLSGQGPDVLLLDGLPLQSYIEGGVLLNLNDALRPMLESKELNPTVAACGMVGDILYALPLRWSVPLFFGSKENINGSITLHEIGDLAREFSAGQEEMRQANPYQELPSFFSPLFHQSRLRMFFSLCLDDWLRDDGVDRDALIQFLTDVKAIQSASANGMGAMSQVEENDIGQPDTLEYPMSYYVNKELGIPLEMAAFQFKNIVQYPNLAASYGYYVQQEGLGVAVLNHGFFPSAIAGAVKNGEHPELAAEFIALMASEELQTQELGDGLPVNTHSLENRWKSYDTFFSGNQKMTGSFSSGSYGTIEYEFEIRDFTQTHLASVNSLLALADRPALDDPFLYDIVWAEAQRYLSGSPTAEETADAIISKVKLYLNE